MRKATVLREVPFQPLPEIRPVRKIEAGRHDTDNEMVAAVQANELADNRSVAVEAAPPESIADHRLEIPVDVEPRVAGETRSALGCHAEHANKVPAGLGGRHAHR